MSSQSQASFARIGAFICIGAALAVAALVWLGGVGGNRNELVVETYFPNDVSGLSVGSDVTFRGVKVGSVRSITFVASKYSDVPRHDRDKIIVEFAMNADVVFKGDVEEMREVMISSVARGLHATVESSGITGLSHVELNFPKRAIADAPIGWKPRCICVPPAPSILESASDAAQRILNQIDRMDLNDVWTNLVQMTSSANLALESLNALLDSQQGNVAEILTNVRDASAAVKDVAEDLRANPSRLVWPSSRERLEETR